MGAPAVAAAAAAALAVIGDDVDDFGEVKYTREEEFFESI